MLVAAAVLANWTGGGKRVWGSLKRVHSSPALPERRPRRPLVLLARLVAGGLFLASGVAKLWAPGPFPAAVAHLVPVPVASGFVIAWLPVAEVALGLLVLSGLWRRASALAVLLCSACFLAVRLASGVEACGCFGALEVGERVGLALDLLLLGSSVVLVADAGTPRVFRRKVRVPFGRDLEGNGEDVR